MAVKNRIAWPFPERPAAAANQPLATRPPEPARPGPGIAEPDESCGSAGKSRGLPRSVEAAVAAAALLAALPCIGLAALVILLRSGRPVIFSQWRVGRGGRPFRIYKLRTMRSSSLGSRVTASGDTRVTGPGKFLRRTKVDELPELWNVIIGDMSLVGPRPEVPEYVDLSNPRWLAVLSCRPGITDPVTVRLRREEDLLRDVDGDLERFYRGVLQPAKLKGYVEYLESRTWVTDIKVLIETVAVVFVEALGRLSARRK